MSITIEVSVGELLDKLAILEIKFERLTDHGQRANVERELDKMRGVWRACEYSKLTLDADRAALKAINEHLWEIEDRIREKENTKAFDEDFIELARAVYFCNDERAAIKRRLNAASGSELTEEKSYSTYGATP